MTSNSKIALLVVETPNGDRHVVAHGACAVPIKELAEDAQKLGAVKIDGATVPIVGGFIVCSWREPCVTWRFRCEPATPKHTKK